MTLQHPILTSSELEKLRSIDTGVFQAKTLQLYFKADGKPGSLEDGLERLCRYADDAVRDGFEVLILSDRAIDSQHAPIPSILAVSAVHHHLIKTGNRGAVGLVVEAGDVWEVHHFACLLAFGATAINPYMALASIRTMKEQGHLDTDLTWDTLKKNYVKAICAGLLKIFSKMGISTLQSYHGAQIFEVLGIDKSVVDQYFCGSVSRIGGLSLDDIATEVLIKHWTAFGNSRVEKTFFPKVVSTSGKEEEKATYGIRRPYTYCNRHAVIMIMSRIKICRSDQQSERKNVYASRLAGLCKTSYSSTY